MVELKGRKVLFFRANIEPGICASPKNAIHYSEMDTIELNPAGVYVKSKKGDEHLVPYGNVQTIKLLPEEPKVDGRTKAGKEATVQ